MKKANSIWILLSAILFLLPVCYVARNFIHSRFFLDDFCAYSVISRALFEGKNPFPDHFEVLFYWEKSWGTTVPIVFPGQMLIFAVFGYLWGSLIQIVYFALNIGIVFFLLGLTLVKACGYQWRDLWMPGKKQFFYALCCFFCLLSCGTKFALKWGQIPIVLALFFYFLFWAGERASFWLRTVLFAFIAVAKYSALPVVAPLLFFKGHWKLCIASFALFVLLSISPVFCGNNLVEVYSSYSDAVAKTIQPGGINHYSTHSVGMCHLDFFISSIVVMLSKALVVVVVLWLFWRERKKTFFTDTLLLLSFSLTMLITYHRIYDIILIYPLFAIRLFDFARTKQWLLFGITFLFPLFLLLPSKAIYDMIGAWIGGIPGLGSVVYLTRNSAGSRIFPVMALYSIALAGWSLYLYLHVKDPYRFEMPIPGKKGVEKPEMSECEEK